MRRRRSLWGLAGLVLVVLGVGSISYLVGSRNSGVAEQKLPRQKLAPGQHTAPVKRSSVPHDAPIVPVEGQPVLELRSTLNANQKISVRLRPDLSGHESVDFVKQLARRMTRERRNRMFRKGKRKKVVANKHGMLEFYRAEKGLLLQGEMGHPDVLPTEAKGPCPADVDKSVYAGRECFKHDPNCGCHGPMMTKGMVGWAGGAGNGPHFFIYVGEKPATIWSHDHTVWGEVMAESLEVVDEILRTAPTERDGHMVMLKPRLKYFPKLVARKQGQPNPVLHR